MTSTDVQTVRSLVEEMETENGEEITDSDEVQQGLGKRVIGQSPKGKQRDCRGTGRDCRGREGKIRMFPIKHSTTACFVRNI